jgi:hypothetical protein
VKRDWLAPLLGIGIGFALFVIVFGPINRGGGLMKNVASANMQTAHTLALALFQYSIDHDGNYSDAKSSTEIFQRLIDGGYITDPKIVYLSVPGKTMPVPGAKLTPENVGWDVTADVTSSSPDGLPLVFMTGYRIEYEPDGRAIPVGGSNEAVAPRRTWQEWWNGRNVPPAGIPVAYKSNQTIFIPAKESFVGPHGAILHFVDPKTDFAGKTYRQLTPDGELPP